MCGICEVSDTPNGSRGIVASMVNRITDIYKNIRVYLSGLYYALRAGRIDLFRNLLRTRLDLQRTLLHSEASKGHASIVKRLIDAGSDIEAQDIEGYRPLHCAVNFLDFMTLHDPTSQHLEAIKILMAMGADIHAVNSMGETSLHLAALRGHASIVETLIKAGSKIEVQNINGHRPLHLAADGNRPLRTDDGMTMGGGIGDPNKRLHTIQTLIAAGVDISAVDETGRTALHYAALRGRTSIVKLLLDAGSQLELEDHEHNRALHLAICDYYSAKSRLELLKLMIDAGADLLAVNRDGRAPIHLAAERGLSYFVVPLVEAGSQLNARDVDGNSPLHLAINQVACSSIQPPPIVCIKILIAMGADLKAVNLKGRTPLHLAAMQGLTNVTELLIEAGSEIESEDVEASRPMHLASMNEPYVFGEIRTSPQRPETVNVLLSAGSFVGAIDIRGRTPLHCALSQFRNRDYKMGDDEDIGLKLVESFVAANLDVNIRDGMGNTALYLAAKHDLLRVAVLLVHAKADAGLQNEEGRTALHWAAGFWSTKYINMLLNANADVNARDNEGRLPLHWAARYGNRAAIEALMNAGSDYEVPDNSGYTPLYLAAKGGYRSAVKKLLVRNVDSSVQNTLRTTALQAASENGKNDVVNLLQYFKREDSENKIMNLEICVSLYTQRMSRFQVTSIETIEEIKRRVADRFGISPNRQDLRFCGRPLREGHVIREYNIEDGHIIFCQLLDAPVIRFVDYDGFG